MCKNCSRSRGEVVKNFQEPFSKNIRGNVPSSRGVTQMELDNLLENFNTDILGSMGSQLDDLQAKKRKDEEHEAMSIFCPRCRTKHPQRECPLNNIFVCHIYTEEHPTDNCPSLPRLQAIYKSGDVGEKYRRPPWKSRDCNTPVLTLLTLKIHDTHIVNNLV